ncbi:MFS transporter [Streptomyces rubiginosohelvolus]|uniref:MFS transporter n=1 Tax=Streptomyces rubiginosohelvolus TaxID=67362 RepID=UPI0037A950BF
MPLALLALAVSAFGIGTTEFVMMGLLPNVADDLGTSVPTAGYLVSAYAIGVVLGAPLLTGLGSRVPRKKMLLLLMALFTIGNLASALAPDFGWLVAGRLLAGLPHGAFFGVGAVVAARLVSEGRQARAVATMFLGLTVANIVGVPAATLLGQHLGWRATFLVVAAIGLAAMAALARLVPHIPVEAHQDVRRELRALGNRQVLLGLLTAVFGFMNKAKDAPTLASASNHSAFNLANAGGAWLGGVAIAAGWGWTSPAFVGAVLAVAGLAIAATAGFLDRGEGKASRVVAARSATSARPAPASARPAFEDGTGSPGGPAAKSANSSPSGA